MIKFVVDRVRLFVGTVVEEVTATDADSGVNAELVYRIQKGAFDDFAINETTGVVTVSRKLDYDEKNTYHVEVIAFDKGSIVIGNNWKD